MHSANGCTHGLAAADGARVKKPWKIARVNSTLHTELSRTRSGDHEHAQCTSKELTGTQMYTMQIADIVRRHISSSADFAPDDPRPAARPGAGLPAAPNQPADTARACLPCIRRRCTDGAHDVLGTAERSRTSSIRSSGEVPRTLVHKP